MKKSSIPATIEEMQAALLAAGYVADRSLATVVTLTLKMQRPLLLEGEAGVGKTEIAKVLAKTLGRKLIRLQCYEGLDVSSAVYEWNYAAQMMAIRLTEAEGGVDKSKLEADIFSDRYLVRRPILEALTPDVNGAPVLLIDDLYAQSFRGYVDEQLVPILLEKRTGIDQLIELTLERLEADHVMTHDLRFRLANAKAPLLFGHFAAPHLQIVATRQVAPSRLDRAGTVTAATATG